VSDPNPHDHAARASADRFRRRRGELEGELRAPLGPHADAAPVDEPARAAAIHAEYRGSERAVEGQDWAMVRHSWPLADLDEMVDAIHRVSNNLRARDVWLVVPGREPQACALAADAVLDNPLGFAAIAGGELLLLDRHVSAGVWLGRHTDEGDDGPEYEWELIVWGEPWLSATTRALRGIG
jgi:hypothetical protein